jgi:hypothetical protein
MKYLLVEPKVKSIAPNIALMKWAKWCEINGHEYQYVRGIVKPNIKPDKILMSCIFSFYSKRYEQTIDHYLKLFPNVKIIVGGVFPTLTPQWFNKTKWNTTTNPFFTNESEQKVEVFCGMSSDIEELSPKYDVEILDEDEGKSTQYSRNKIVLYSSRGCVNKCGYCAVPKLEGDMHSFKSIKEMLISAKKELPNASSVVLYDNNFTAHEYFDNIVDELIDFGLPVDIHGLHVSSFTEHQAEKFSKLKWAAQSTGGTAYMRFSFDWVKYYKHIDRALGYISKYDIKAGFFCYLLFNWKDSPDDFWKRIVLSQELCLKHNRTIFLFPQRFEPFMALTRNSYIGEKWNEDLVRGCVRLYTFLHGFLPLTKTRNIFNWVGYTKEEFFDRCVYMSKNSKLIKKNSEPPSIDELMKTI